MSHLLVFPGCQNPFWQCHLRTYCKEYLSLIGNGRKGKGRRTLVNLVAANCTDSWINKGGIFLDGNWEKVDEFSARKIVRTRLSKFLQNQKRDVLSKQAKQKKKGRRNGEQGVPTTEPEEKQVQLEDMQVQPVVVEDNNQVEEKLVQAKQGTNKKVDRRGDSRDPIICKSGSAFYTEEDSCYGSIYIL
mmetsp:Transcript_27517/g.66888  ORF Transcript_27517/g.66888 Transcript_27517/m.66888 type:complete len:188 (+) Transcript_27517:77-640(+)